MESRGIEHNILDDNDAKGESGTILTNELPAEGIIATTSQLPSPPKISTSTTREELSYSSDLFHSFADVIQKAKRGVQSCQAVAAFVQERTNAEATYARAMLKVAQNAKCDDWAPGFSKCWASVQEMLEGIAREHAECASKMQTTISAGAKAFATQQEVQVQRLITEGTKCRTAYQSMMLSMDRAKEKYDRKCAEAIEMATNLSPRRMELTDPPSSPTGSTPTESLTDDSKVSAGAAQMLSKMWDTTSSFAKTAVERQRNKLDVCLEEVISSEKYYLQTVDYVNVQRVSVERDITDNLLAFQLTEEQRIEYLKDVLVRMEKIFIKGIQSSQTLVDKVRNACNDINEYEDIEQGFHNVSCDINPDEMILNPADNPFTLRMAKIQKMSEHGHHHIRVFFTILNDIMMIEDHFTSAIQRLVRAHEGIAPNNNDLFNMSNNTPSQVCDEGETMSLGWKGVKNQAFRIAEIHYEFRSLLSEPVAHSLSTMKQEYENARVAAHDNYAKAHTSLCNDVAMFQKHKVKVETKTREFVQLFASLPDMGGIDLTNVDVDQALVVLQQISSTFIDKDKRTEAKLKILSEELRELQRRTTEFTEILKKRSRSYIQDIDVFISLYMKNEKYRLQVAKSSLQSLSKAFEHLLNGEIHVSTATLEVLYVVDAGIDVVEFIRGHRKPHEQSKQVVPAYHNDDTLKAALEDHSRNRTSSPTGSTPTLWDDKKGTLKQSTEPPSGLQPPSSPTSSNSDKYEDQPLGVSDFQKKFKLDTHEEVVESYSCALFNNNFPIHGRLYLTRDHLCFAGWRETICVMAYQDISSIEKKNTALIVPNAIEVIASALGEKVFFTSFVFRDECFNCLQQLMSTKKATTSAIKKTKTNNNQQIPPSIDTSQNVEALSVSTSPSSLSQTDNTSPTAQASVAPAPPLSPNAAIEPLVAVPSATVRTIPKRDEGLDEYEIIVEEEVPFSVEFAHSTIWVESPAFILSFYEASGDTNINLSNWNIVSTPYTAISKPDTFDGSRMLTYTHNKKYIVGPSSIPTTQAQRFKWIPNSQLIMSVTSTVTDVPYCDYFRAEVRWAINATPKDNVCSVQVGIRIQWLKSTWLKKQIESAAIGEAKETTRAFLNAAIAESKKTRMGATTTVFTSPIDTSINSKQAAIAAPTLASANDTTITATITSSKTVTVDRDVTMALPVPIATNNTPYSLFKSQLHIVNVLCILFVVYIMYRTCIAMEQMQLLTKEGLLQQQEQQEILRQLLNQFQQKNEGTSPST